ncbi:MAG: hypothetical protein H6623_02385 [Bdellovibrionaceae bacterium]|nr:hypothetical protein [Pseudobdellovibrionaceae bacterium]
MRIFRSLFVFIGIILIAFLTFGLFLSRYDLQLNADALSPQHKLFYDYRGVTHVLSSYSGGGALPADIAIDAGKAKIDFVYLSDYNDFDPTHEVFGYNSDVAMFTGKKLNYLDANILLYSSHSIKQIDSLGTSHAVLSDLLNQVPSETSDILTVLAHPFRKDFEWEGPYPSGLQGIEVMNLRHMWQQRWLANQVSFIWSCLLYLFNPKMALLRLIDEPVQELNLWDQLNSKRKTIGLLGSHATGVLFKVGSMSIPFPRYEDSFRFGSNHILLKSELTGVYARDSEKIQDALTTGHFYFAIDALANPRGFAAYLQANSRNYLMGDTISFNQKPILHVDIPPLTTKNIEVRIYRDGMEVQKFTDSAVEWPIDRPGVYRVQVRIRIQLPIPGELRWIPWIYTNNFYVR